MFIMNGRSNGKRLLLQLYKASFYNPRTRMIELKTFKCEDMTELERQLSILSKQGYEYDPTLIPFQEVKPEDWEKRHEDCLVK